MILNPHHKRKKQRHDAKKEWHRWFAWYPVHIDCTHELVWLQYIARKGKYTCDTELYFSWDWTYSLREVT